MGRSNRALLALAGVLMLASCYGAEPARAQSLGADPCGAAPCRISGAAVKLRVQLPMAGHFAGKWELVPLFSRERPVIRNGHQYLALRNTLYFRRPNGELIIGQAGMPTDEASIPRVLWPILPPDGPYGEASWPHDLCYKTRGDMGYFGRAGRSRPSAYTRAECDEILREGMVALGVSGWKRIAIYEGVRLGGAGGFGS